MTSDAIIRVERLGKKYQIGHKTTGASYTTFREAIGRSISQLGRNVMDFVHGKAIVAGDEIEEFWALKEVGFNVRRGEVIGVIGGNGAGKSTLLKVLSRVTEPSEGRIEIQGRVASLLEVGTGFHPELTGRENIFLNGAILGMKHLEIKRKFDEILAFSGVERFLDTPVKRYSSGMYVRLAFAVAAHLEPEILIVDEVLAVGDAQFQKKCLGKMKDVASAGRTVLFVSHNMAAVSALCNRCIILSGGRVAFDGPVDRAIEHYSQNSASGHTISFNNATRKPAIRKISVDRDALARENLVVEIEFESGFPFQPIGGIVLSAVAGGPVWGSNARFHKNLHGGGTVSRGVLRCEARQLPLVPGEYFLSVWLGDWYEDYDMKLDVLRIDLVREQEYSKRPPPSANGHLDWPAVWSIPSESAAQSCASAERLPVGGTALTSALTHSEDAGQGL